MRGAYRLSFAVEICRSPGLYGTLATTNNPGNYISSLAYLLAGCVILGFGVYTEVLAIETDGFVEWFKTGCFGLFQLTAVGKCCSAFLIRHVSICLLLKRFCRLRCRDGRFPLLPGTMGRREANHPYFLHKNSGSVDGRSR